jgi:hypothetical protein
MPGTLLNAPEGVIGSGEQKAIVSKKSKTFFLTSSTSIDNALNKIRKLIPDGTYKVTISRAGSKSSKQRGLQFMWYEDISKSGIGGKYEDDKNGVHLVCKYRFAVPIFCRDDDFFNDLYSEFIRRNEGNEAKIMWFIEHHVSTEKFNVEQMAEYLTAMQRYYASRGVNLTDPEFQGLL